MGNSENTGEHPLNAGHQAHRPTMASPFPAYEPRRANSMDARQVIAFALIAMGMIGVIVAWFGISGTLDPGKQMPYLASGGIGGAALIAIGVMVYVSYEHVQDRMALAILLERLDAVEQSLRALTPDPDQPDVAASAKSGPNGGRRSRPAHTARKSTTA